MTDKPSVLERKNCDPIRIREIVRSMAEKLETDIGDPAFAVLINLADALDELRAAKARIAELEGQLKLADAYIDSLPDVQPGWTPSLESAEKIDYYAARARREEG